MQAALQLRASPSELVVVTAQLCLARTLSMRSVARAGTFHFDQLRLCIKGVRLLRQRACVLHGLVVMGGQSAAAARICRCHLAGEGSVLSRPVLPHHVLQCMLAYFHLCCKHCVHVMSLV
jgi:hypothetical protein